MMILLSPCNESNTIALPLTGCDLWAVQCKQLFEHARRISRKVDSKKQSERRHEHPQNQS
jgi:hypothetical protein